MRLLLAATAMLTVLPLVASCAAEECTIVDNEDGTSTLTCPDGTSAALDGGADGADGADGAPGADGAAGADGVAYLVRIDDEPAGANCADGGLAVHSGPDTDGDGVLGDPEIEATAYVCDGEDGDDALVRIDDEPAGANCEAGGFAVHVGLDLDDDGLLDDNEITSTEYVCHGVTPAGPSYTFTFPSDNSVKSDGSTLATGGGAWFSAGETLTETFDDIGLPEVSKLDVMFEINDTTSPCSGGAATYPLSWDVSVNGVVVGSFDYVGGQTLFDIPFDESYSFAPVSGTGATGESYTITFTSNDPVCPGGGFWGWVSGGETTLHQY